MSAQEFLDLIAQKGLLEDRVIEKIRIQVRDSPKSVSAESLAKVLVKKGQLTASQSKQLLESTAEAPPPLPQDHYDDLGLAPDETQLRPVDDADDIVDPVMDVVPVVEDHDDIVEPVNVPTSEAPAAPNVADSVARSLELDTDDPMVDDIPEESSGRTVTRKRSFMDELTSSFRGVRGKQRKKITANRWDSPLMLVGGGTLLLLILVGIALYFFLARGTGDDAFNLATESYRQQAYDKAIGQFESFLSDYPAHPKESSALVHIGMANIWREVEMRRWDAALATVRTELPAIQGQEAFGAARPELATLLPEIMEGFADQALKAETIPSAEQLLGLANQTFEEVNNSAYLPTSVRRGQQPRIEQIEDKLASVKRRINRDQELENAVLKIKELAAEGQIADAYDVRKQLLRDYPSVELDDRLEAVVRDVAETERAAVKPLVDLPQPMTTPVEDPSLFRVVLADRRGEVIDSLAGQAVIVSTNGAVFGLSASDGSVQWRYPVGYESTISPLPLDPLGESDVVVVSQLKDELVRLSSATGDVVWRLPCPGPLVAPQLDSGTLIVACTVEDQGWVMRVDPKDGTVVKGVSLPVPISTPPAIDSATERLIQPAAYATVYTLNLGDLSCESVSYLGHSRDTISVPAILAGNALIVVENPGIDFSLIHVLTYDDGQPGHWTSLVDPKRVEGQVVTPLQTSGRRVLLATDRGQIRVFDVDMNQPSAPLQMTAEATGTVQPGTRSYVLFDRGRLWVGDNQLTRYELQTSRGQLVRKWINSKGDLFLSPMQLRGDVLFHVRKRSGRMGATVAAVAAESGERREGESIWETDLAVPSAGEPFVDRTAKEINVVTANGALFAVGSKVIRAGIDDTPRHRLVGPDLFPLNDVVTSADGRHVYVSNAGSDRVVLLTGSGADARLKLVTLDVGSDRSVETVPVAFRRGLLVATQSGTVDVFSVTTGQPELASFQPPIRTGASTQWLRPATFDRDRQAILGDARGHLFHLSVAQDPKPHVVALRQQETDAGFIAPPIVIGEAIGVPVRGNESDVLRQFGLADLKLQNQIDLPGRLMWGPYAVGNIGLLMTDQGKLVAFDDKKQLFVTESLDAPVVGRPALYQDGVVLATVRGEIVHFDGATGKMKQRVVLNEALGTGPVQFLDNRFILCAGDGTLHVVALE